MLGPPAPGSGAVTLLTAACSRSARSQKRQPTWFPHWPTAKGRDRGRVRQGTANGGGTGRRPLTLHHHRLRHGRHRHSAAASQLGAAHYIPPRLPPQWNVPPAGLAEGARSRGMERSGGGGCGVEGGRCLGWGWGRCPRVPTAAAAEGEERVLWGNTEFFFFFFGQNCVKRYILFQIYFQNIFPKYAIHSLVQNV